MHAPTRSVKSFHSHRPNAALCASAGSRLIWAAGALALLWATVFWALS